MAQLRSTRCSKSSRASSARWKPTLRLLDQRRFTAMGSRSPPTTRSRSFAGTRPMESSRSVPVPATGRTLHAAHCAGVDVLAFDTAPAPAADNPWFAGSPPWYSVERADHRVVSGYAHRTLLIVWPTKNETWPLETVDLYAAAGGCTVVYVGEGPGGKTGDDAFHSRLGMLGSCRHCTYGLLDVPCVCDYPAQWAVVAQSELPHWPGCDDNLTVHYRRPRRRCRWHGRSRKR